MGLPAASTNGTAATGQPLTPSGGSTAGSRYVFPVVGDVSYARGHHDYPASDILAKCGAEVRAVTNGVVLEVNRSDDYNRAVDDGATRGGLYVAILGDDGVRYYGSHFSVITEDLRAGRRVQAGEVIGKVGETGDASACHLHFGISPPCGRTADWAVRRGVIWPWPYLDSWRRGGAKSPATEIAKWQQKHHCR